MTKQHNFFLHKAPSPIHGMGIFSEKEIMKGAVFYKVPLETIFNKPRHRAAHIGGGRYAWDDDVLNWINHSCDPNARLELGAEPSLVALRDIRSGEEISCDYNQTEVGGARVDCSCQSKNCGGLFLRKE